MDIDEAKTLIVKIYNWDSLVFVSNILNFSNNIPYELNLIRASISGIIVNQPKSIYTQQFNDFIAIQRDVWLMALSVAPININEEGRGILNQRVETYRKSMGVITTA